MKNLCSFVFSMSLLVAASGCNLEKSGPTAPAVVTDAPAGPKGGGTFAGPAPSRPPAEWTSAEWHEWFMGLTRQAGQPHASSEAMSALRSSLNAVGADWQNGWRGDYRTRIYLPTGFCPPPLSGDVPDCSYDKAVDVGENGMGQPWSWVPRF